MIHEVSAMTVRKNLGELLNEVQYRHDSILITKGSKPAAALIPIALFQNIVHMKKQFEKLTQELAQAYAGVPASIAEQEIQEALAAAKGKK